MSLEKHVGAIMIQCTATSPGLESIRYRHLASVPLADSFLSLYTFLCFVSYAQNVLAPLISQKKLCISFSFSHVVTFNSEKNDTVQVSCPNLHAVNGPLERYVPQVHTLKTCNLVVWKQAAWPLTSQFIVLACAQHFFHPVLHFKEWYELRFSSYLPLYNIIFDWLILKTIYYSPFRNRNFVS